MRLRLRSRFRPRDVPTRQRLLPFRARMERLDRLFRRGIVGLTALVLAGMVAGTAAGRYAASWLELRLKWAATRPLGLEPPRAEIDADWRNRRRLGVAETRRVYQAVYDEAPPALRNLMRVAGLDPAHAVVRWGNYDRVLVLSSKVFAPDDTGRSYRLLPHVRSIWLREVSLPRGVHGLFLVPDVPELYRALPGTVAIPVPESVQTTNAWGCRGPEPDPDAPVRGLVLGDSYMQGLFIGDDQAPPECLRRRLQAAWKVPVSILNTGHLGYSLEQYYYTLLGTYGRFRPHFVLVSLFANDVGDTFGTLAGEGDWQEGAYWLAEIQQFCRSRGIPCVVCAIPLEQQITSRRNTRNYQGEVSRLVGSSIDFIDPTDDLVNGYLHLMREATERGRRPAFCPLFNGQIADGHFSPAGAELWAESVGRRLVLRLRLDEAEWRRDTDRERAWKGRPRPAPPLPREGDRRD